MKKTCFLSFSMIIVGVCICISCGYLLSTAALTSFQFTSSISSAPQTVFAISMKNTSVPAELEKDVQILQSANGAGFIYEKDGNFLLLASVYENLNDAELVKTNLKSNGADAEIVEIDLQKIVIDGNFNNEEKTVLSNAIKAKFETFKSLYDIAISLDTGVFDKQNAKLKCSAIYSSLLANKTNLDSFLQDNNKKINDLKSNLTQAAEHISSLICENYSTATQTLSSLIKETYCKILFEK